MWILQIICYQMLAGYVNNKFFIDLMVDFLVHSLPQSSSCFPIVSLGFFCRFTLLSFPSTGRIILFYFLDITFLLLFYLVLL